MKRLSQFVIMSFLLMAYPMPSFSAPGGDSGHGGGGFICPDPKDNELLDLWEARYLNGWDILDSADSVESQISAVMQRFAFLNPTLAKLTQDELDLIFGPKAEEGRVKRLNPGGELPFPTDTRSKILKAGCKPVGVGNYDDRAGALFVDPRVLEALPKLHQAAFWIHESVFRVLRAYDKDTDSIKTRGIVGKLFSASAVTRPAVASVAYSAFDAQKKSAVTLFTDGNKEVTFSLDKFESQWLLPSQTQTVTSSSLVQTLMNLDKAIIDPVLARQLAELSNTIEYLDLPSSTAEPLVARLIVRNGVLQEPSTCKKNCPEPRVVGGLAQILISVGNEAKHPEIPLYFKSNKRLWKSANENQLKAPKSVLPLRLEILMGADVSVQTRHSYDFRIGTYFVDASFPSLISNSHLVQSSGMLISESNATLETPSRDLYDQFSFKAYVLYHPLESLNYERGFTDLGVALYRDATGEITWRKKLRGCPPINAQPVTWKEFPAEGVYRLYAGNAELLRIAVIGRTRSHKDERFEVNGKFSREPFPAVLSQCELSFYF